MRKLAIVTTHPIQYYAPLFKLLQQRQQIDIKVFYTWGTASLKKHDPGFGEEITWDLPLLDGYPYEFLANTAKDAGSHHYNGIINPGIIQSINSYSPDAILVFGWAYKSHLKVLSYFKNKVPVLFRGDSTLLDEKPGVKNLLRFVFLRWIYSHVDHAFYPGSNTKAYFKKYGLGDEQLIFAPHAIDNARFADNRLKEANTLRQYLKINETDILILYAGKFEDKKDPLLLIDTFVKLGRPNCHLLLVGNGILETALKNKAAKNSNIHFMGFQNQSYMPVIYQACDMFCLPSKGPNETWGLAVNEAMAGNKAVLLSDKVGCGADLVKPGFNGNIFKNSDADDLLKSLKALTQDKALLQAYGKNSGVIIKEFTFTKIAEAIENKLLS